MLAGSGAAGAPTKVTTAVTCKPSGVKLPLFIPHGAMQPVPRAFISRVQAPSLLLPKAGGNGSSMTSIVSGVGGDAVPPRFDAELIPKTVSVASSPTAQNSAAAIASKKYILSGTEYRSSNSLGDLVVGGRIPEPEERSVYRYL
jgi:hypothetical protein